MSSFVEYTASVAIVICAITWVGSAAGQSAPGPAPAPSAPAKPALGHDGKPRDAFAWRYPQFGSGEYVATGVFGGLAIAGLLIPTPTPRWTEPTTLDVSVRDALRLSGRESRKTADDISDLTLTLGLNYAAFDATVVAWALRDKGSVAYQMAAINVEVIAVTAGITGMSKALIARERPYAATCRSDSILARTDECEPEATNVSFISGHSSIAFAAASVTCMHHVYLELYQSPAADALACIGAYGAASATGVLRILSDNHYATDVAAGAAVGTAVGLGLPWLLHYRDELPTHTPGRASTTSHFAVTLVPGPTSASLIGVF